MGCAFGRKGDDTGQGQASAVRAAGTALLLGGFVFDGSFKCLPSLKLCCLLSCAIHSGCAQTHCTFVASEASCACCDSKCGQSAMLRQQENRFYSLCAAAYRREWTQQMVEQLIADVNTYGMRFAKIIQEHGHLYPVRSRLHSFRCSIASRPTASH